MWISDKTFNNDKLTSKHVLTINNQIFTMMTSNYNIYQLPCTTVLIYKSNLCHLSRKFLKNNLYFIPGCGCLCEEFSLFDGKKTLTDEEKNFYCN